MGEPRPWNGWSFTPGGSKWHRVEFDSRTNVATLRCTGRTITQAGEAVLDYRWAPDTAMRCLRCQPLGEPNAI